MKRFGMGIREVQAAWKLFKQQQELLAEDLIDISVQDTGRDRNVLPRDDEYTQVYQVAIPSSSGDVYWRSLHSALQQALKMEVAKREVQNKHQERFNISDKLLQQRAEIQSWFLAHSPVSV